ncbi:SMI1/KNR4 family protein [Gorillibacterium sp. CAU 1737]|uniref:SMI1/KNR4 family protein n=1 Tax=Gorillibacterium sp. CAU 1737 TaxID=3140362 RepID=UPI0032610B91
MLADRFQQLLSLAQEQRPDYPASLGSPPESGQELLRKAAGEGEIPDLLSTLYRQVSGTRRSIPEQHLMDFLPGYRLIHITELLQETQRARETLLEEGDCPPARVIPFLANYSGDFYCVVLDDTGAEKICVLTNLEGELEEWSASPAEFLETVSAFYREGAFTVDADGFLEVDFDKVDEIGQRINPDSPYWMD